MPINHSHLDANYKNFTLGIMKNSIFFSVNLDFNISFIGDF